LTWINIVETITSVAALRAEKLDMTMVAIVRKRVPDLVPDRLRTPVRMNMTEVQTPVPVGTPW